MTHYETLDVGREASADDIKQAFRRKAKDAHPDRNGGDNERMAIVNRAYEVLGDPERRARYDQCGDDREVPPMAKRAVDQLVRFFERALEESGNIVRNVRREIAAGEKAAQLEIESLQKSVEKLTRRRDKVRVKKGDNLVHMLIDAQLNAAKKQILMYQDALTVGELTKQLLDDYECEDDVSAPGAGFPTDRELMSALFASMRPGSRPGNPLGGGL